jgi:TatD DNase family protein
MAFPYIDIHTHHRKKHPDTIEILSTSDLPLEGLEASSHNFYSHAVHPWYLQAQHNYVDGANTHLQIENCLALGEVGLDKLSTINFNMQQEIFTAMLDVNRNYNLPVIIHCVKAQEELLNHSTPNIL